MKSSPLDHIKIASPCPADWDEMRGNKQKRFCTHCQLSVYNLSEMSQREAENFLFESEGKICVRLYRRHDGTVITEDCPVGWQAVKQKVSRVTSAVFGLIVGFVGGLYGHSILNFDSSKLLEGTEVKTELPEKVKPVPFVGEISNSEEFKKTQKKSTKRQQKVKEFMGRTGNIRELKDEPVEVWIK